MLLLLALAMDSVLIMELVIVLVQDGQVLIVELQFVKMLV